MTSPAQVASVVVSAVRACVARMVPASKLRLHLEHDVGRVAAQPHL